MDEEIEDLEEGEMLLPPIYGASDFHSREVPEIQYALSGFIPEGLTIMAAGRGVGKSTMSRAIAYAVATGTRFANSRFYLGNPGEVLLLSLEDGERQFKDKMACFLRGRPFPDTLQYVFEWPRGDYGLEAVRNWIVRQESPRLVIIDTRWKVLGGSKDYDCDRKIMEPWQDLCKQFPGVGIVLLDHTTKDDTKKKKSVDSTYGSGGVTADADCRINAIREDNAKEIFLQFTGRALGEKRVCLTFDGRTQDYEWKDVELGKFHAARRRIIMALRLMPDEPVTVAELAQHIGQNKINTKKMIYRMVKDKQLIRGERGQFTLAWHLWPEEAQANPPRNPHGFMVVRSNS
jgi:hypothetical protein